MGLGGRATQHAFSMTPAVHVPRSTFNRSFGLKDAFFFDLLNPIYVDEILPGDTINMKVNAFCRLAPLVNPPMDNMYLDFFFFFVPNRLVWTNWEKFCGAQDNPGDSISYTIPTTSITVSANTPGELYEKMGIPLGSGTQVVNALPFRAYNLIWNTWFRSEDINSSLTVNTGNGPDTYLGTYLIQYRNARHDYFTSCLPWPQKGTAINLLPAAAAVTSTNAQFDWKGASSGGTFVPAAQTAGNNPLVYAAGTGATINEGFIWKNTGLELAAAAGGTINQLRTAFQVQSLLELDARGGTRYVELLLAHFGVTSPDYRLQRPEYLGGGQIRVNSNIVPQSAPTSGSAYFAQLGAFATASTAGANHVGFSKSFTEHGYVIGLAAARADLSYQRGIDKMWTRSTRYDFFWPKLQEIGEQAVTNREIWADSTGSDAGVFGYQERFAEYKYKPSRVQGYFASVATGTLDSWHMARKFLSCPTLNGSFLSSSTPVTRALANSSATPLLYDAYYELKHTRCMATYSVPAGLGRF